MTQPYFLQTRQHAKSNPLLTIDDTHILATYSCFANIDATCESIFAATLQINGQAVRLVHKHGTILTPQEEWEKRNVRDPFPIFCDKKLYLYYAGGGEKGIGLAISA